MAFRREEWRVCSLFKLLVLIFVEKNIQNATSGG
jgi:hypothetical protein